MPSLEAPAPSTPEVSSQSWLSRVRALLQRLSGSPVDATLADFQEEARALNGAAGDCAARLMVPGPASEADALIQRLQDALGHARAMLVKPSAGVSFRADAGEQERVAQTLKALEGPLAQVGMLALLTQSLVARIQSAEAIARLSEARLAESEARVRELEAAHQRQRERNQEQAQSSSAPAGELVLA